MDYVLANPPFNIKDWARNEQDPRWRFGVPPAGNANYAWIQHILSKLAPGGQAGVVMANGSMSSNTGGEGDIRARIVEADLVSCMVALPTQLFRSTGIPVCLWFFATDKLDSARARCCSSTPAGSGYLVDRAERALTSEDIARIGDTYHAWRASKSAAAKGIAYGDVPGFCKSATLDDIRAAGYALTPGRYVGAPTAEDDGEPVDEKIARLTDGSAGRTRRIRATGQGRPRANGARAVEIRLGDHLDFRNGSGPPERTADGRFPVYGANGAIGYRRRTQRERPADRGGSRRIVLRQSCATAIPTSGSPTTHWYAGPRIPRKRDIGITRCRPAG